MSERAEFPTEADATPWGLGIGVNAIDCAAQPGCVLSDGIGHPVETLKDKINFDRMEVSGNCPCTIWRS